jgi:tetratricopeptide (TPR) repeat protein
LEEAEEWRRRSLELTPEGDRMGRSIGLGELGHVALECLQEAQRAKQPEAVLLRHLNDALGFYRQRLQMMPPDAIEQLAVGHNALGTIYGDAGRLDRALDHCREAIRYTESAGDVYGAGAQQDIQNTLGLFAAIDKAASEGSPAQS